MTEHSWKYEPEWMQTAAGKHVGGFSSCRQCGLMRFSRAGYPPQHYYVRRDVLDGLVAATRIRPGAPEVMNMAPECVVQRPAAVQLSLLKDGGK